MTNSIFESARKLNELLEMENKKVLVKNGRIIGFINSTKKKRKKK